MSMLSSCTLMSLAPTPAPRKKKFVSPAELQLRTKQPVASSSSALSLPRAAPRVSTRALRLVCHAYDILPTVLLNPSVGDYGNWKINEDKHHITLEFDVGEGTKEDSLSVRVDKVHEVLWLVITYTGDGRDTSPATSLNVRLQMPTGYDEKNVMKAEILPDGWLQIILAKPKQKTGSNRVTKPSSTIFQPNTDGKPSPETTTQ